MANYLMFQPNYIKTCALSTVALLSVSARAYFRSGFDGCHTGSVVIPLMFSTENKGVLPVTYTSPCLI